MKSYKSHKKSVKKTLKKSLKKSIKKSIKKSVKKFILKGGNKKLNRLISQLKNAQTKFDNKIIEKFDLFDLYNSSNSEIGVGETIYDTIKYNSIILNSNFETEFPDAIHADLKKLYKLYYDAAEEFNLYVNKNFYGEEPDNIKEQIVGEFPHAIPREIENKIKEKKEETNNFNYGSNGDEGPASDDENSE